MTDNFSEKFKKSGTLIVTIIFVGAVLFGSASAVSYNLFFIAAAGACSAWLIYAENIILGIIPVVPAYIAGYFISGSFLTAAVTAVFVPIGILVAHISFKKLSRATACAASGAIGAVILIAVAAIKTYVTQNGIGITEIKNCYSDIFETLGSMLQKSTTVTVAGNETSYITSDNVDKYLNLIVGMLPGCIVMISTVTAYISAFFYNLLLKFTGKQLPEKTLWRLSPSPVTSMFFVFSVILSFALPSAGIVWFAAVNFSMILVTELIISGLNSITEIKVVDNIPRIPLSRMIISVIALLIGGLGVFLIYALLCGVTDSIIRIFRKKDKTL